MNNRKGLSQILWLIVAASVLMIAALSLVFMLQGGLQGLIDFGGEADETGCETALSASCQGLDDNAEVDVPSSCISEGNVIPPASQSTDDPDGQISCAEV